MNIVQISNLSVAVNNQTILKNVDLSLTQGSTLFLLGPNGSGKSSLTHAILGHPDYKVVEGSISIDGHNVLELPTHKRAQKGLFLAFQQPLSLPGVSLYELLLASYSAHNEKQKSHDEFEQRLNNALGLLGLEKSFTQRSVNDGMSGGEKKKAEMLQMLIIQPKVAILDEIDSGLDVDALKLIATTLSFLKNQGAAFLIITHYNNLLTHIHPDQVLVMKQGSIVAQGDSSLAHTIQEKGFVEF